MRSRPPLPANFNLISIGRRPYGVQSFFGQGAGRYPTAYNVVQDLVDITRGVHAFYTDSFVPAVPGQCRRAAPLLCAHARRAAGAGRPRRGRREGAVITQPIPVSRMHALMAQALGQDGESFFAALQ